MVTVLKPGMVCVVRGAMHAVNNGRVVTLIRYVGQPPEIPGCCFKEGHWWRVDSDLLVNNALENNPLWVPLCLADYLWPIDADRIPAEQDFQAWFKQQVGEPA